jgi:ribonuclease BN (tRNA processing enzyme)
MARTGETDQGPSGSRLRVALLPSAVAGDPEQQYATSYLVNGCVAVDAGSIGLWSTPAEQDRVRDVLLTHSHADHVASLPLLMENTLRSSGPPLRVWAGEATLRSLSEDVFNDRVWPRLEHLTGVNGPPLSFHTLEPERTVEVAGLEVTPVPVSHPVPTFGYLIRRGGVSVLISGDTGPTERLGPVARAATDLRAVFLEVAFPDELAELARVAGHHTPASFARQCAELPAGVPVVAVHLKPRYRERILAELAALELPGLVIGSPREELSW